MPGLSTSSSGETSAVLPQQQAQELLGLEGPCSSAYGVGTTQCWYPG